MMNEDKAAKHDLRKRTKTFALRILRLYSSLPRTTQAQILGKQLLRSGTSAGAHYREACRARSSAEFVSKIECGLQELEETTYWMELLVDSGIVELANVQALFQEAGELTSILVSSAKTAKRSA
jgi:four helix bundle protein